MADLESIIPYAVGLPAILASVLHIVFNPQLEKYAVSRGVLNPAVIVKMAALLLLACGILTFIGDLQKYALIGLSGYSVLTALILHKFWDENDRTIRLLEGIHFLKSLLIGGLLILLYFIS